MRLPELRTPLIRKDDTVNENRQTKSFHFCPLTLQWPIRYDGQSTSGGPQSLKHLEGVWKQRNTGAVGAISLNQGLNRQAICKLVSTLKPPIKDSTLIA